MSDRMLRINELLRSEIAKIVLEDVSLPNGLITITQVKCSADLHEATVFISVLPESVSGTALKLLRAHSSLVSKKLKKLNLKSIPRINWKIDSQERFAADLEKAEVENEEDYIKFNESDEIDQ